MPQVRVTKKFASDLKIENLLLPQPVVSFFDDWLVDTVIFRRKKIAMATHVESRLTFFFPYCLVGGAKNVTEFIGVEIQDFISKNKLKKYEGEINCLFKGVSYVKNIDNKSLIANMTDLKNGFLAYTNDFSFETINWHETNDFINNIIIRSKSSNNKYICPKDRMINLLKGIITA